MPISSNNRVSKKIAGTWDVIGWFTVWVCCDSSVITVPWFKDTHLKAALLSNPCDGFMTIRSKTRTRPICSRLD